MRRLFYAGTLAEEIMITGDDAHHLARVMRAQIGDEVMVADTDGRVARMAVASIASDSVCLNLVEYLPQEEGSPAEVILVQALLKGEKMDFVVQKAVELGAAAFYPVITEHVVVRYDAKKAAAKAARWQKIADEAAKQCGRTRVPSVDEVRTLKELIQEYDRYFFFIPYEGEEKAARIAVERAAEEDTVICIGPEGGYAPEEIEELTSSCEQYAVVSLGKRIMRAETAALAACSVIMYERGFV